MYKNVLRLLPVVVGEGDDLVVVDLVLDDGDEGVADGLGVEVAGVAQLEEVHRLVRVVWGIESLSPLFEGIHVLANTHSKTCSLSLTKIKQQQQ